MSDADLQTFNRALEKTLAETVDRQAKMIAALREALVKIERIGWREGHGEQARLLLIDCRAEARAAIEQTAGEQPKPTGLDCVANEVPGAICRWPKCDC